MQPLHFTSLGRGRKGKRRGREQPRTSKNQEKGRGGAAVRRLAKGTFACRVSRNGVTKKLSCHQKGTMTLCCLLQLLSDQFHNCPKAISVNRAFVKHLNFPKIKHFIRINIKSSFNNDYRLTTATLGI